MSAHIIHGKFQKPFHLRWTWESHGGQFHHEMITSSSIGDFARLRSLLFRSSTWDRTLLFSALDSASQCVERESYEEDSVMTTSMKNTTGPLNIFSIALGKQKVYRKPGDDSLRRLLS
ncbi:hypothetical protein V3C99_007980 [Haemonchus contortus]